MKSKLYQWQTEAQKGGICEKCGRIVEYLTVDHIVPQSFVLCLDNGKWLYMNDETNFQFLCQPCNKMKGASWDFTNKTMVAKLKQYLEPYL